MWVEVLADTGKEVAEQTLLTNISPIIEFRFKKVLKISTHKFLREVGSNRPSGQVKEVGKIAEETKKNGTPNNNLTELPKHMINTMVLVPLGAVASQPWF